MRVVNVPSKIVCLLLVAFFALTACKTADERANEHYESGLALLAEGDVDRAILEFRNVFQLDATHREAREALGRVYLEEKNDKQRAYRQFLRVVEQYPDDLDVRVLLAEIALLVGNMEEVERHGSHAEELAADAPRVQAITAVRAYGTAARADDEPSRRAALQNVSTLLEDQPDNAVLRAVRIDDALREGDFETALEDIDFMLEQDPLNQQFMSQRLGILAELGDDAAIETQLRDMITLFPENDTHKATLIRFYLSRNELQKAEDFLRTRAEEAQSQETRMDLIRFILEVRGTDAAREELRAAAAAADNPLPFELVLASLDFTAGDRQAAIAKLEELVRDAENTPEVLDAKVALAKMQLASGNEVGARARVSEILAADEGQVEALKMQAAWQIDADETDAAIAGLRTALDREPNDAEAMTLMSQAYARVGRPELSQDFLALAVEASGNAPAETIRYARFLIGEERYLPAEDILLKALRLTPQNLDLLIVTGELYLQMNDFGRAEQVVRTLRGFETERATQAANAIEAERISRQSGTEDAVAYLESIANSADASLSSQIALVRARLATGDIDAARSLIETLSQERPEDLRLTAVQAGIEAASGNLAAAETIYRDLLAQNPQASGALWLELARLKIRQEDPEAFRGVIEEALTHLPENAVLLLAKAGYLEQDGKIDDAVEIYETLYAANSDAVIVANNLASLLSTYKDDAESLERAWIVARRFRDVEAAPIQDTYGWIMHRRGNSEEALPYLEAAAEGLPEDPIVQYHLAEVYAALDRREDALNQYQTAVSIAGPTDQRDQIRRAKEEIQRLRSLIEN
ncbi:tetratricopeptide repeat protein [uncultured Roseobacter sp.]|uniref:tetratricopeptide repeat protein n=1 Tax=uncultured Roseobacter sp. TaxID=114847 RepID=UPI0026197BEC|nr:tetratricopeptide repeat protein [uncultured Roseobacter sp.]